MSSFEKLSLQGVRSFGPQEQDRQQVKFDSPLTIIVGRNGCGKTTIIESLRYITCGEFPPGSKGIQFVHDPKIAHEVETKAQVRLKFNDVAGKPVMVTRNMQALQKQKKSEFKTIEGVISRMKKGTDEIESSMSSKCADIDKEMAVSLGVSKAVLNNVIFCHQEESNWPLEDGKSVKTRFDEIFAASRYIKAIDELKKVRKHRSELARQYETEASYLKSNRDKCKELKALKEDKEKKREDMLNRKQTLADERQVNEEKCEKISSQLKEINKIISKRDSLKTKVEEKSFSIRQMEQALQSNDSLFYGSDEELNNLIENHDTISDKRKQDATELEGSLMSKNSKIERLTSEIETNKMKLNELKTELALHEKDCANRDQLISELAKDYNLSGFDGSLDRSQIERFKSLMSKELKLLETRKDGLLKDFSRKEKTVQDTVDKCMLELGSCENSIKRESEELRIAKAAKEDCKTQLREIQRSASKITDLKAQIAKAKEKQNNHEKSINIAAMEKQRDKLKSEIETRELKVRQLAEELNSAYRSLALHETVANLKSTIETKQNANDAIISKREDDLLTILDSIPKVDLKIAISRALEQKSSELTDTTKAVNEKSVTLQSLKYQKTSLNETLSNNYNEKMKIESEIDVEGEDYEKKIEKLTGEIKEIQDKIGYYRGSSAVYSHYCAKLKEKNPKCPVCFRGFEAEGKGGASARESIDRLQELKNRNPSLLKSEEQKLKVKEAELKKLYDSKHLYVQYEKLRKEILEIKKEVESVSLRVGSVGKEVEEEQQRRDFVQSDVTLLQESVADAAEWDRNQRDLSNLRASLSAEEAKMRSSGQIRSTETIESDKQDAEASLDFSKLSYDECVADIESYKKALAELQLHVLSLEKKLLDVSSANQKAEQISEKLEEQERKCSQLEINLQQNKDRIAPLKDQLDSAKSQKAKLVNERDAAINKVSLEQSSSTAKVKQISEVAQKVNSFDSDTKNCLFSEHEQTIQLKEGLLNDLRKNVNEGHERLQKLRGEVANEAIQRRAYEDNLTLRLAQQEKNQLTLELKEVESIIGKSGGASGGGQLQREYEKAFSEKDKLTREFHQTAGQLRELEQSLETLEKQLSDPLYKEASSKWVRMVAEWKANKLACADLDKFGKALDSALMRFHSVKMAEINQVLSQLWRDVYTGGDIDSIEIRTEEGENSSHTRKTYNYRVVMIKEGVELDMRGRCSAGQKVLACLLIRLALAETFSMQCAVFSLDEPTTNLDRENISSLADALVRIITTRSNLHPTHSQFIIITHDMDFVELLGTAALVEYYHEVSRDEYNGLSRITRKHFREIESNS